ncbi:FHA domain-containing protein [bacterium]|nr:FHA domain-containing protein [bacterium]
MDNVGAYLDALAQGSLERETFLKENAYSFLVTIEQQTDQLMNAVGTGDVANAPTVYNDAAALRRASIAARDAKVYKVVKTGANQEKDILVGRSRDNDVCIEDAEVSKRHARFAVTKDGLTLVDNGSTNGTYVNDAKLEAKKAKPVRPNDAVRFGRAAKMQLFDAEGFFDYLTLLRRFVGL